MTETYFSDREVGPQPRVEETIQQPAWGGVVVVIRRLDRSGAFGLRFPELCPDGEGTIGTDEHSLWLAIQAEIPGASWPLDAAEVPPTLVILDLVEFCHRNVAEPSSLSYHSFYQHSHLGFDPEKGQVEFRQEINRIFARNGLAFELGENGEVVRLGPPILREALQEAIFNTGDAELDAMLEAARTKYSDSGPSVRRESLEKLWDAWERVKTLELVKDKKASVKAILDQASSEPRFREALEKEALELTRIGNSFQIRHSEADQTPIESSVCVDYLFHRLFAMISLLLRTRAGEV